MKNKLPSAKELYEMYQGGLSMRAIAEKLECSEGGVRNKITRAGYESRSLSEAHKLAYETGRHLPTGATGSDHWAWKGGAERRSYRNKVNKEKCSECESRQNLSIHHIDFDHYNNDPDNLDVLCVSCHQRLHKKNYWDAIKNGLEPMRGNDPIGWDRR